MSDFGASQFFSGFWDYYVAIISIVSVLGSLFPVFTVGLSVGLLDDRLSPAQAAGMVASFTGIALIAAS